MKIKKLDEWNLGKLSEPLIIAGPCSAESEEQMLKTAKELSENGIRIFRAGIWKPRTRPGSFEGVGVKGLAWMKKVKQETKMLVATEVANVNHVFEALKAGVDILWVGARTSVNPFAIQEIADALKGVDIPVLVKNPVNPDLDLWIGAIERLNRAGITRIAALHRGFSGIEKSPLRNEPYWQMIVELKQRIPNLPIINDPSRICGNSDLLLPISQKAIDLQVNGLMVESHCNPDKALSDKAQQVTPKQLNKILEDLKVRSKTADTKYFNNKMSEYRSKIDIMDDIIVEMLGKRMQIADKIGLLKKENNVAILQSNRWVEIIEKIESKSAINGLKNDFINTIFKTIHDESINRQEKILSK